MFVLFVLVACLLVVLYLFVYVLVPFVALLCLSVIVLRPFVITLGLFMVVSQNCPFHHSNTNSKTSGPQSQLKVLLDNASTL